MEEQQQATGMGIPISDLDQVWERPSSAPLAAGMASPIKVVPESGFSQQRWLLLVVLGSLGLALVSIAVRSLLPVDETRYVTVAWEMWNRGDFLVPFLNGAPYDHKPPLLFWLMHAGWAVFGVNEWWPRLIAPLSTIGALLGLQHLAALLWPEKPQAGRLGTLMLLSSWYLAAYQTGVMFDMLLMACVAWGWVALYRAVRGGDTRWWAAYGLTIGLGLLAKGPVVLVYAMAPALAWRTWVHGRPGPRALQPLVATVIALALPGLWLAAAIHSGSEDYFGRLLMDQTLQRVHGHLGHPRPLWWYLPLLPLLPLPWLAWPRLWRHVGHLRSLMAEPGVRFVGLTAASGFIVLSLVSGKQVHYLIPLLALAFLLLGRVLAEPPLPRDAKAASQPQEQGFVLMQPKRAEAPLEYAVLRIAVVSIAFVALLLASAFGLMRPRYDLAAAGAYAGTQQQLGRPLAYVGNYQGEFGFYGKLSQPVTVLRPVDAARWAASHPEGLVIARLKRLRLRGHPQAEFSQPYKSDQLLMFGAGELLGSGSGFSEPLAMHPLGDPI